MLQIPKRRERDPENQSVDDVTDDGDHVLVDSTVAVSRDAYVGMGAAVRDHVDVGEGAVVGVPAEPTI